MMFWDAYLAGLLVLAVLGAAGWLGSLALGNVNLVDSLWSLFFLAAAAAYAVTVPEPGARGLLVLALAALWSLRLAGHLTLRNWGKAEDRRYRAIRAAHEPGFAWKSLFIVFWLQAFLAWVISLPLHAAMVSPAPLGVLDVGGAALVLAGVLLETVADRQLARFKADSANRGRVLDRGLWRWSRHPNYFGDACVWWGLWLIAASAGAWWSVVAPLLMTFLLLRISGVSLLERDITDRRPAYREYIERTSAFVPWPPKRRGDDGSGRRA